MAQTLAPCDHARAVAEPAGSAASHLGLSSADTYLLGSARLNERLDADLHRSGLDLPEYEIRQRAQRNSE